MLEEAKAGENVKKEYRIKKSEEFSAVFQNGTSYANQQFVVYVLDKPGQPHLRAGFTVGKKLGNAVTRNQMKRKMRELVRIHQTHLHPEKDYVLIARKPVLQLSFQQLERSFIHVMKRAKVWNHENEI